MALSRFNLLNVRSLLRVVVRRQCSSDAITSYEDVSAISDNLEPLPISPQILKKNEDLLLQEIKNDNSFLFTPAVPQMSQTVAAFVNKSELLQNLVKFGVNLSKIEEDREMTEYLIKSDFKEDVLPYILFLRDQSVSLDQLGNMITKHPKILKEPLGNLQLRIDYFKSKEFSIEAISRIVMKEPSVLTTSTLVTDKQLGFLQKTFLLTGDEIREVVEKYPKLLVWNQNALRDNKLHMNDMLGFEGSEIKSALLADPKLLVAGKFEVAERFDYLHNTIGFSHEDILLWPQILRTRLHIIKQRNEFLRFIGKAQFDRKSENFVSMKALVEGTDSEFCETVAKVPVQMLNDFLKSV